jgi:hypothetical protein
VPLVDLPTNARNPRPNRAFCCIVASALLSLHSAQHFKFKFKFKAQHFKFKFIKHRSAINVRQ